MATVHSLSMITQSRSRGRMFDANHWRDETWGDLVRGLSSKRRISEDDNYRVSDLCDVESWRWSAQAACTGTDPDAWFQDHKNRYVEVQREICASCPVRQQCLDYALEHDEYGMWGGTTDTERRKLRGKAARR